MADIAPDTTASAELTVGPEDLASRLVFGPGDSFPEVLATTRMIALMEVAAARAIAPIPGIARKLCGRSPLCNAADLAWLA